MRGRDKGTGSEKIGRREELGWGEDHHSGRKSGGVLPGGYVQKEKRVIRGVHSPPDYRGLEDIKNHMPTSKAEEGHLATSSAPPLGAPKKTREGQDR